ncbi:hypothetical protein CROQUDRAFT_86641 [Cronartium quercuum f. sp. fusiforme G11]|uniref:Uncharacterized protein n=1 Tax=Cronartium quercuum f. sp. fusiforme G11 TaxID=708437 RepID=A0A9P6TIA6_9BASI|nr:hypothetical protein CROQUDRAFT_86641 [Cronartium quercuum f. sp. fusiforme G11]
MGLRSAASVLTMVSDWGTFLHVVQNWTQLSSVLVFHQNEATMLPSLDPDA